MKVGVSFIRVRRAALGARGALVFALVAAACGSDEVSDEVTFAALSSSERQAVCDELQAATRGRSEPVDCGDGVTVSVVPVGEITCTDADLTGCEVTVGQWRECLNAVLDDGCAAFRELPPACAALQAPACFRGYQPAIEGCSAPIAPSDVAPLEGIYELVSHTENLESCDAEGPSRLEQDGEQLLVVVAGAVFSTDVAVVHSCSDVEACRAEADWIRNASAMPFSVEVTLDDTPPEQREILSCVEDAERALLGASFSGGPSGEGDCVQSNTTGRLTFSAGETLRIERRDMTWRKPEEDGGCSVVADAELPTDAQCSRLELLEARFVEAL